ncbi:MAG: hypothetical protein IKT42_07250 [Clostridia bacterium]|nr:hypothetical protein [Clostridia bacterium]
MDILDFVLVLILGISMHIMVSMLSFIDFLSIVSKIFPNKVSSDFKEHKNFISSNLYKIHKRKWRKIFFWSAVVYAAIYSGVTILFDSILVGFYSAIIVSALCFGILSNIEYKQRKTMIFKFRSETTHER